MWHHPGTVLEPGLVQRLVLVQRNKYCMLLGMLQTQACHFVHIYRNEDLDPRRPNRKSFLFFPVYTMYCRLEVH